jgi:hypothetical protein
MVEIDGNIFIEEQKFRQTYIWIILITLDSFYIIQVIQIFFIGELSGDIPGTGEYVNILLKGIFMILLTLLMWFLRLDTAIRYDGIYYRYFPFQRKYKKIEWANISNATFVNTILLWSMVGGDYVLVCLAKVRRSMFREIWDFSWYLIMEKDF